MKYVFDYEEILQRRVTVHADNLGDAIVEMHRRIDEEEIVLGAEDFAGGEIKMPLEENFTPYVELEGEPLKNKDCLDVVIDVW